LFRERKFVKINYRFKTVERGHWGDPDANWRKILRWIFRKREVVETGWRWLRIGTD